MTEIQPQRLSEIDRAEILRELEGSGFHALLRAHFLYEDVALGGPNPPKPHLYIKHGQRWHQVRDGSPANDTDNYEALCGRFLPRNAETKCFVDANYPVPGEICSLCKTVASETYKGEKINHPRHYNMGGAIGEDGSAEYEVIKIIEDLGWGYPFCMGNALKYVLRAPHKGAELEDLQKARWYLERAERHKGSILAHAFRKMTPAAVCEAWQLYIGSNKHRLAMVVFAIMNGDPVSALEHYKLYLSDRS